MNICSLRYVGQLNKRAFILAHCRALFPVTAPALNGQRRHAHNNLFQMVKKRALEARSKLQANAYPNNKPILKNESSSTAPNPSTPPEARSAGTIAKSFNTAAKPKPKPPANLNQNPNLSIKADKSAQKSSNKTCHNVEVLHAPNCSRKSSSSSSGSDRTAPTVSCTKDNKRPMAQIDGVAWSQKGKERSGSDSDPCAPTKSVTSSGGSGGSSGLSDQMKLLLALAAALGLGGLVWLLMSKSKKESSEKPVGVKSSDLPKHVPYLLIGGGTAAFSAFRAIKTNDARAKVLMITDEHRKPYMRPPLSKELWYTAQGNATISKDYRFKQWTGAERSLFFEPEEFFIDPSKLMSSVNGGIAVAHGHVVKKVDPATRTVTLSDGYEITYDECLLATGCTPKSLPIFANVPTPIKEKIMLYRTPDDFEKLKRYVDAKKNVTIIGNGFIGSELACSLANYRKGGRIFQIFPESGNMSRVLPDYLSKWTMQKVESQGVCVLPNASIVDVKREKSSVKLTLSTGDIIMSDIICVCIGCEPNTSIAKLSGLEVDRTLGGFVVNAELEARRNLYAAGDVSCFYDPLLGRRRVEHHDHSVVSGRLAGENMVGKKKPYSHQSMFWSDLGPEIGYEGIGLVDSTLPTVGVFALPSKVDRKTDNLTEMRESSADSKLDKDKKRPSVKCDEEQADNYGRGVIFYLRDDKVVGILLWNLFNRIGLARTIIDQNQKFDDLNELAKLFEIHA